jgi:hypothetical protein
MEVFAHFDIINSQGVKVAEGHKASFCLEDNQCTHNTEPVYKCANYGDQGISVNCTDTYHHNIDCQWIDITDIDPGIYTFKVKYFLSTRPSNPFFFFSTNVIEFSDWLYYVLLWPLCDLTTKSFFFFTRSRPCPAPVNSNQRAGLYLL